MIIRSLKKEIVTALAQFPVVGLIGPRQCGKTTLAKELAADFGTGFYLDLEKPSDLSRLADPELFLSQYADKLIILDEIQRLPDLFPLIRSLVDADRRAGRFLILGSASPDLARQSSESLAGRIIYKELTPFLSAEIGSVPADIRKLWVRGGYPLSWLAETDDASMTWREAFIASYLERDIPQLGIRVPASMLRRFWQMLAHCHGRTWNSSSIAANLGVSPPTIRHYLDILQDTFMVRQLQPYHANRGKRLVKAPKFFVRDSGILHTLQRVGSYDDLLSNPGVGLSFEGFVIEQIIAQTPSTWEHFFYRTSTGNEIDLILMPPGRKPLAVEIKHSLSPVLTKGFFEGFRDIGCDRGFVVYPGTERYELHENVTVIPAAGLAEILE